MMLRVVSQRTGCLSHLSRSESLLTPPKLLYLSSCQLGSALEEMKEKTRSLRPLARRPKMKMEPYVKNLFRGTIDPNVFAFPELDLGSLKIVEDMKSEMQKFMNGENISTYNTGNRISKEEISKLKELGIFKGNIPRQYGGLELTCTELTSLAEVFAQDLSLFHTLNTHLSYISNLFTNFASEKQKEQYLPLIASGDLQIGLAIWEENATVDLTKMECSAEFHGNQYVISGKKMWVANGGIADKFVVFANEGEGQSKGCPSGISCFLVDKHAEGVSAKSMDTVGVQNYNVWEVTFNKTIVPLENVIGVSGQGLSMLRSLIHGKFTLAGAYVGLLRDLIDTTVRHAINKETFGKPLIENDIVKSHLAQAATRVYALESIAYLTADFYDCIEEPDMEVEAAIVRLYSSESLIFVIQKCLSILGSNVYLKDKPYERILRDALFSPMVDCSSDTLRMTIALLCLHHVGRSLQESVVHTRNPLLYPQHVLKSITRKWSLFENEADYKAIIHQHVHPSFEPSAEILEKSIIKLGNIVHDTLVKWGRDIDDKQMNLARLADIAVDLYVSTAALARASRSISVGLRNCDVEGNMASSIVLDACDRIDSSAHALLNSPYNNNDANYVKISQVMLHERRYHVPHPLSRNW